jgi:hypothetical protein
LDVGSAEFNADGTKLVTGANDRTGRIWSINSTGEARDASDSVWAIVNSAGVPSSPDQVMASLVNHPNPASTVATIEFTVNKSEPVHLDVVDTRGEHITSLIDRPLTPGSYSAAFDVARLPAGAYFYTLTTSEGRITRPMIVQH